MLVRPDDSISDLMIDSYYSGDYFPFLKDFESQSTKHLVCHHKNYMVKPLMRDNRLYEIAIYSDKNILYRFRDSLTLLPDAYTPYGENLFYYDVNSLYPFVMKSFPLLGGKLVWHSDLVDKDLDSLFGSLRGFDAYKGFGFDAYKGHKPMTYVNHL
ncbi:hypothetical protein ACFE04_020931 [Oxalis oulophora]